MRGAFGLSLYPDMKKIKFTALGSSSAIGSFSPGDTARLSDDLARHLVEEARCAEYVFEAAKPAEAPQEEAPKRRKAKD
jgi:hypothetical protein